MAFHVLVYAHMGLAVLVVENACTELVDTQNSFQGFLPVDKAIVKPKCPRNVTAAKKFH